VLPTERPSDTNALDGRCPVQPGAAYRRGERHHPMVTEPTHPISGEMSGQRIPHQHHAQGRERSARRMTQPGFPACRPRSLLFGRQGLSRLVLLDLGEDRASVFVKPGMQDRGESLGHACGTHLARGRTEEGEPCGGAPSLLLMRMRGRVAFPLPRGSGLRDGLGGSRLIVIALPNPGGLRALARPLASPFFSGVSGSDTVTVPLVRVRRAEPVRHQVRVRGELEPDSGRS
jgi:hypothetical protein